MAKLAARILFLGLGTGVAAACGARGPLDLSPDYALVPDASGLDVQVADTSAAADAAPPFEDAAPDAPPSPIQCATCAATHCGSQLQMCLTSTSCRGVLQCVVQKCSMGGKLDPTCLAGCAGGDPSGVLQAVSVVQCITTQCGSDCLGLLPTLGGDELAAPFAVPPPLRP